MAFHVLVYAHMRLTVLVIENACTELDDIASVMSQNRSTASVSPAQAERITESGKKSLLVCS